MTAPPRIGGISRRDRPAGRRPCAGLHLARRRRQGLRRRSAPRQQPADAAAALADGNPPFAPNAFIRIDADGGVRLVDAAWPRWGRAIYTGSAMLLAEELGRGARPGARGAFAAEREQLYGMPLLGGQITGGSTSTRSTYGVLREAGAVARTLLVAAAAAQWKVEPASCTVARGVVSHAPSGRQLGFGALAASAAKLPMPSKVTLKDPKDFTVIGKPLRRVDSPDKVNGTSQFGIDIRLPGMKVATVQACPTLGGTLASVDDKAARAVPGVIDVIRIANAVAVVGEHFWAAKQGLDALKIQWDAGRERRPHPRRSCATRWPTAWPRARPSSAATVGKRPEGTLVEATYQLPMLAHATMEPLNTTVHVKPDSVRDLGRHAGARALRRASRPKITGLPEAKVVLHNQYLGGGFGRRLEADSVEQAVAFAKQVPYPLKVVWTREEDIRHDIVRPMYHDNISRRGGRERQARLVRRPASAAAPCSAAGRRRSLGKDGMDGDLIECVAEPAYDFPNLKVEWVRRRHAAGPGRGRVVARRGADAQPLRARELHRRTGAARQAGRWPTAVPCCRRTRARWRCSTWRPARWAGARARCPRASAAAWPWAIVRSAAGSAR